MTGKRHAFVLPKGNYHAWLEVVQPYAQHFEHIEILNIDEIEHFDEYPRITVIQPANSRPPGRLERIVRRFAAPSAKIHVIQTESPQKLARTLQNRINREDPDGKGTEKPVEVPRHKKFTLTWVTDHRPFAILPLDDEKVVRVVTQKGAKVLSGANGRVDKVFGDAVEQGVTTISVVIRTEADNRVYWTTYANLANPRVGSGQLVKRGEAIGSARGDYVEVSIQRRPMKSKEPKPPENVNPLGLLRIPDFGVRPLVDGLRVRDKPGKHGTGIAAVNLWRILQTPQPLASVLLSLADDDGWIKVILDENTQGFVSAEYIEIVDGDEQSNPPRPPVTPLPSVPLPGGNPVGINLDIDHAAGQPAPSMLGNVGWVRLNYDVSREHGSLDLDAAFRRYEIVLRGYANAGYKIMLTLTHETYGEARQEYWDAGRGLWIAPDNPLWGRFIQEFTSIIGRIVQQWQPSGLIDAWQIWNEQDAQHARASVPLAPYYYADMLTKAIQTIRTFDRNVFIITGGHNSGPHSGRQYAAETLQYMPANIRPDGIAFHPYGRGISNESQFQVFGHINTSIRNYGSLMPQRPLWITEWGVLNQPHADPNAVGQYAADMIRYLREAYPGKIAALIWYAWADGMDNGYGVVNHAQQPKSVLYDAIIRNS